MGYTELTELVGSERKSGLLAERRGFIIYRATIEYASQRYVGLF